MVRVSQRWLARFVAIQELGRMKTITLTNIRMFFGLLVAGLLFDGILPTFHKRTDLT
jgi:hypothetical protein